MTKISNGLFDIISAGESSDRVVVLHRSIYDYGDGRGLTPELLKRLLNEADKYIKGLGDKDGLKSARY